MPNFLDSLEEICLTNAAQFLLPFWVLHVYITRDVLHCYSRVVTDCCVMPGWLRVYIWTTVGHNSTRGEIWQEQVRKSHQQRIRCCCILSEHRSIGDEHSKIYWQLWFIILHLVFYRLLKAKAMFFAFLHNTLNVIVPCFLQKCNIPSCWIFTQGVCVFFFLYIKKKMLYNCYLIIGSWRKNS